MLKLYVQFESLMDDEKGQVVIEYGLVTLLIAVAAIGGYQQLAGGVAAGLENIKSQLGV
jgi:Flp pilus assembly pilin Flp